MVWLIVAAVVAALILAGAYYAYRIAFFNEKKDDDIYHVPKSEQYQKQAERMRAAVREMDAIAYEQVYITARDGLKLAGRYYHLADGTPLQIQMHGYRGNALRDFCGGHKLARKMGQNTLVIDQRAHGKSDGHVITFGVKERYDCLDWIHYAVERFGPETPVFLAGVSMGAATVIMASELELPKNVAGILADCPYSAPGKIIRKVCKDMNLPPKLAYPFVSLGARIYGKFHLEEASAEAAARHAKVPILIIHGEDDRFVPCEMSAHIRQANPQMVTLETFPEAGHGLSYLLDSKRYEALVRSFSDKCLASKESV